MNSEEAQMKSDVFLRDIPNVKISAPVIEHKRPVVKEELKLLHLTNDSQEMIMDTLKYIHGDDFELNSVEKYVDKGTKYMKRYWLERGNLVIKGITDFSNSNNEPQNEVDRMKMFQIMRLESYGFHKTHCEEALEHFPEIEDALALLYSKYFNIKRKELEEFSEKELLEQRDDEKSVLESIYESKVFKEKVKDEVWILTFKLDYLVDFFYPKKADPVKKQTQTAKKKEKCKNFVRSGTCKFGTKCRFSHEEEDKEKPVVNGHLSDYSFELEVRFPKNSKYPHEAPLIFLKTNLILPEQMNLHICRRLYEEADNLAEHGMGSVYSVAQLLQNDEEILKFIETNPVNFLKASSKLFPKNDEIVMTIRASHYKKGTTNRQNRNLSFEDTLKNDTKIARDFLAKSKDNQYKKMQEYRKKLPAWSMKEEIIKTVNGSKVIVICGETGCGKSTQVPQFILDDWLRRFDDGENGKTHAEIVCTQPRRISAIGVAERVSNERIEKIGQTVGYQIRLESKVSNFTRLTFCTTGILLRRLEVDPMLSNVSHIIVDEVHERSVESDFLLLVLKDLLQKRSDLKVILMSATVNSDLFSSYFGGAPVFEIPGRTFPVEQYFLEDILDQIGYKISYDSQYRRHIAMKPDDLEAKLSHAAMTRDQNVPKDVIRDENLTVEQMFGRYYYNSDLTCESMFLMDQTKIDYDLIEKVLEWFVDGEHNHPKKGSILIFLPGIGEITSLYNALRESGRFGHRTGDFLLIPLHSTLTSEEQALVFKKPKEGVRKIVISTNIAETSITIEDCVFVIDSGKMKEKHFDPNRNMESLETVWVTKANALQRKGRAGRVMPGVCVHLFSSHRFNHNMLAQPIPEIHRIPLEPVLLDIKILPNFANRTINGVLATVLEPPTNENISSAIVRLKNVGAFDQDDNLTPLGHHLALLPVDVKIGKLMLYGAIFGCVDSALTMAAILSHKSPFVSTFKNKNQADAKRKDFASFPSDQITSLRAYKKWLTMHKKSYTAGQNFANENYMSIKTLLTIVDIKYQFLELLVSIGFVPIDMKGRNKNGKDDILEITGHEFNKNGDHPRLLTAILTAALYPNIVKILTPGMSFVASSSGAVPKSVDAKELKFFTKNEQVNLHPSSVLYQLGSYESPYLVYQEIFKTSRIFIRECSMVSILALVLFSGFDIDINVHNGMTFLIIEDGWISFRVDDHKIAEMIKMMRLELIALLEEKIKDPLLNLMHHDRGSKIISTINHLILKE